MIFLFKIIVDFIVEILTIVGLLTLLEKSFNIHNPEQFGSFWWFSFLIYIILNILRYILNENIGKRVE